MHPLHPFVVVKKSENKCGAKTCKGITFLSSLLHAVAAKRKIMVFSRRPLHRSPLGADDAPDESRMNGGRRHRQRQRHGYSDDCKEEEEDNGDEKNRRRSHLLFRKAKIACGDSRWLKTSAAVVFVIMLGFGLVSFSSDAGHTLSEEETPSGQQKLNLRGCVDTLPDCGERPVEYCTQDAETMTGCKKRCGLCKNGLGIKKEHCDDSDGADCSLRRPGDLHCAFDASTRSSCMKTCGLCAATKSRDAGMDVSNLAGMEDSESGKTERIGALECFTGQQHLAHLDADPGFADRGGSECTELIKGKFRVVGVDGRAMAQGGNKAVYPAALKDVRTGELVDVIIKYFRPIKLQGTNFKRYESFFASMVGKYPLDPSTPIPLSNKKLIVSNVFRNNNLGKTKEKGKIGRNSPMIRRLGAFDFDRDDQISSVEWQAIPLALLSLNTLNNGPTANEEETFQFWRAKMSGASPRSVATKIRRGAVSLSAACLYYDMAMVKHSGGEESDCEKRFGVEWDSNRDGFLSRREFSVFFRALWGLATARNVKREIETFESFFAQAKDPEGASLFAARVYGSCDKAGHTIVQERGVVMAVYVRVITTLFDKFDDAKVVYDSVTHVLLPWEARLVGRAILAATDHKALSDNQLAAAEGAIAASKSLQSVVDSLHSVMTASMVQQAVVRLSIELARAVGKLAIHLDSYGTRGSMMCDMHAGQLMITHDFSRGIGTQVKLLDLDAWNIFMSDGRIEKSSGGTCNADGSCQDVYDCRMTCSDGNKCILKERYQIVDIFCRDVIGCVLLPFQSKGMQRYKIAMQSLCTATPDLWERDPTRENLGMQTAKDLMSRIEEMEAAFEEKGEWR